LKADVQGSIEPIQQSLDKIEYENVTVKFIATGTGNVSESDVALAVASGAIVIAFSVDVDPAAKRMADAEGVDIRYYNIIYKLIEDVDKAMRGMLEPVFEDVVIGHAEVRAVFRIPRKGAVAGVQVTDGKALRNAKVRVVRGSEVLHDGKVSSLKRFTEDVQEVNTGFECGIGVDGFNDFVEGDVLEMYRRERVS
jgi:translation initiation factor IF-2